MKKNNLYLFLILVIVLLGFGANNSFAQEKLLSGQLPNGTTNISGEIIDATSNYKMTYYNLKYLEDRNSKSYYQFNSGMGSYVKIEAPAGEFFQQGDQIKIDVYVNRGSSDSRVVSIYDRSDYSNGGVLVGSAVAPGSVADIYNIVLGQNLPNNTSVIYIPATSSINSYINIHGIDVYGERGRKAKLASLTVGGTANLDGYKVNYSANATTAETMATINYTKEEGKDVSLAISDVQTASTDSPSGLSNWQSVIPASVAIPSVPGESYYYYIRSSLADHETVYYELKISRRNTEDIIYNYDLTVNPIVSVEDPTLSNIINTAGYHSSHGWRFNYASGNTLQVKVEGDAIIKLRGCAYNNESSKITASVNNEAGGNIVPNYQITAIKDCAGYNNFYYTGEANTITFTYSGVTYLSYITIINEGSAEADLRAVFVGESEIGLNNFINNEYTVKNVGYISDPTNSNSFPSINFGMKSGLTAPITNGLLYSNNHTYTYTFEFGGATYKVHIPFEAQVGYSKNEAEHRYDISTAYGLKTVVSMINNGTAAYSSIYLPNGTYDLGDIDGSYQHGITISAPNVLLVGESHQARITGKYYGVTSSVVEIKGANSIVRNLTIENLIGDNGVAPALSTGADNILFDNVHIISWQDTYVGGGGTHLFNNCVIMGSVDFICNGGENTVDYFLRCELQLQYRNNGGYISAPQGKTYFRDCRVTNIATNSSTMNNKFALARPWRETGKAFFINTTFDIIPYSGFVTMSGNIFPVGSCGSVGNIKENVTALLDFTNDANTTKYTVTETDIETYSSVYKTCGSTLAALISEPVIIPVHKFTTIYAADALVIPTGITAYNIKNTNNDYAELEEAYTVGNTIPAFTPVILYAEVNDETNFLFSYADNSNKSTSGVNLLLGSPVHQSLSSETLNYYLLNYKNDVIAFEKQGNNLQNKANTAYLALNDTTTDTLPLKGAVIVSINGAVVDNIIGGDNVIYDLQGKRVSQPQKGLIYIVNGSKRIYFK